MPGAVDGSSSPTSKPCYASADYQFKTIKKKVPIAVGIKNPHVFYQDIASSALNNTNWTLENETDLWGCSTSSNTAIDASVRKTIYDPSPSGFCLPASGVFSATTINEYEQNTDRNINGDRFITLFANNQGGYFYCKPMKAPGNWDTTGGTLFFPNSLGRNNKNGNIIIGASYYWTATAGNLNTAPVLSFSKTLVSRPGGKYSRDKRAVFSRAGGFSVRPVRE